MEHVQCVHGKRHPSKGKKHLNLCDEKIKNGAKLVFVCQNNSRDGWQTEEERVRMGKRNIGKVIEWSSFHDAYMQFAMIFLLFAYAIYRGEIWCATPENGNMIKWLATRRRKTTKILFELLCFVNLMICTSITNIEKWK